MQISKNLLVICAMALLTGTATLRAAESEAQAKAREALRQKMSELDAQTKVKPVPAQVAPAPTPPTAPVPVAPAPTPPAAVAPAPANLTPAPVPSRVDDEATTRAREAMRQKLRELDTLQHGTPATATAAPAPIAQPQTPVPAAPAPATVQVSPTQATYAPAGQPADDETAARARAALRKKMAELDGQQPSRSAAWPGDKQVTYSSRPEFAPIASPPLPVSGPKAARLTELLRQYKSDEITPEQYHKQRAKILAEP